MKKPEDKLFVARKYIKASSLAEAIKKEPKIPLDEIWIDEKWKEAQGEKIEAIGFHVEVTPDEDD